jgi:alkaline phosphatase D
MPIRESKELYRSFSFGPLADVIMLDERLAGRDPEITDINNPSLKSNERSMLGTTQLKWFENTLQSSRATWKVIGNQVIFSDVFIKDIYPKLERNLDSWDGFPSEKKKLVDFIRANKIQDIIITSGDTHASWAFEAAVDITKNYEPFAVEFGVTSISSGNLDERKSADTVKIMEQALLKRNPHIKYNNHRDHGYLLLTLYPTQTKAEWYFMETLKQPVSNQILGKKFIVTKGSNRLKEQ